MSALTEPDGSYDKSYDSEDNGAPDDYESDSSLQSQSQQDLQELASDMGKLRQALVKEFSFKDEILASALGSIKNLTVSGNTVTAVTQNSFVQVQLVNARPALEKFLTSVYGRKMLFVCNVELVKKEERALPAQVEILRDVFKGSVLGWDDGN